MHWTRLAAIAVLGVAAAIPATPAGAVPGPPPAGASALAYPTGNAWVSPTSWKGDCSYGRTFTFTGQISVLFTPETVRYRWIHSDNTQEPERQLYFGLGQTVKSVVGTSRTGHTAGTHAAAIEILSPVRTTSNWAAYSVQCTNTPR
ncbi:hypothetical protein ACFQ08_40375 [Streptosporangium algeriense]|uniref:Ig-like domain-containing protein n=1 Tax=Streptosporangium algeriense TaxID=1682748 RepID=A0ABW3E714_9ACTN